MKHRVRKIWIINALAGLMLTSPLSANAEINQTYQAEQDTWVFCNTSGNFFDKFRDNLFPEHLEAIQNNLNHVEYRLIENMVDRQEFYGMCYGFSITSMLAGHGVFVPCDHPEEFGYYAQNVTDHLSSVKRLNSAWPRTSAFYEQSLIAYYSLLQGTDAVRQASIEKCGWTIQQKLNYLMQHGEQNQPVLVCYNAYIEDEFYGHAVLAYGLEHGTWEWDGKTYDTKILIYDPNKRNPNITDAGYAYGSDEVRQQFEKAYEESHIYVNASTYEWTIPYYQKMMERRTFDLFGLIDDVNVLNDKGLLPGTEYLPAAWTDVMCTNALLSEYTVTVQDSEEKLEEYPWFYMDGDENVRQNFVHRGDETNYSLCLESPQKLHTAVYYKNMLLVSDSCAGIRSDFDPSGRVSVKGSRSGYSLEMVANENYPTQWYDIIVSATAEAAALSMQENGYLLQSDDLSNVVITAKNLANTQKCRYSAETDSILFYETDLGQLAAAVDLDGNGSYETTLKESSLLGDVTMDERINAKDANAVLIAAAKIGTGYESGLSDAQQKAADVDGDGNINAVDAAWILQYAAAIGTGNAPDSLETYVKSHLS